MHSPLINMLIDLLSSDSAGSVRLQRDDVLAVFVELAAADQECLEAVCFTFSTDCVYLLSPSIDYSTVSVECAGSSATTTGESC